MPPAFRRIAAASPDGEAKQEAEIIPAAAIGDAVNADRVGEPRADEGDRADGAVDQPPKNPRELSMAKSAVAQAVSRVRAVRGGGCVGSFGGNVE